MNHSNTRIQTLLDRLASPKLAAIDLSLERMRTLLAALGNPQDRLPPVVHVAGTNGKGSLLAYLAAILQSAGYKAHRYISPHLVRFNERISLSGSEIDDDYLLQLLEQVAMHTEHHPVTFFEATTAVAFLAFSQMPADIVLLETGLGGRLDATNLVRAPLLTAIMPVSMDHMEYLGNTLQAIAAEKAGIIKPGVPCVVGPQRLDALLAIEQAALTAKASLYRYAREWKVEAGGSGFQYRSSTTDAHFPKPNLAGGHQIANASAAIACVEQLQGFTMTADHIAHGITHAQWPARLQRLISGRLAECLPPESELWLDGGHNPSAGKVLAGWASIQKKPIHLICGMLNTKDSLQFLKPLAPHIDSLTAIAIEGESQSQAPEAIAAAASQTGIGKVKTELKNDIKNTLESVVNEEKKPLIILICGSLYLAGNILWQNNQNP